MLQKLFASLSAAVMLIVWLFPICPKDRFGGDIKEVRPNGSELFAAREDALASGGGWYVTMNEEFDGDTLPEQWVCSPHGLRNTEYWCDNMVEVKDGQVLVKIMKTDDNVCDVCPAEGVFTSGIETRKMVDGKSVSLFEQAYGYFECQVQIPKGEGLWSAFWLQSANQGSIGNKGRDGTEIDVYESVFMNSPSTVAHAAIWNGYGAFYRDHPVKIDVGYDLYEGTHTYGLLWTPKKYVFFVDGTPTFETRANGVCQVPDFLRLTIESRPGGTHGPHGYLLDEMTNTRENPAVFAIDWVKVYQNTEFEKHIKAPSDFASFNKLIEKPVIKTVLGWFGY